MRVRVDAMRGGTHRTCTTPHTTYHTPLRLPTHPPTCLVKSDTFRFESDSPGPPPNVTLFSPPPPRLLVCVLAIEPPSPSRSRSLVGEGYSFHPRASFIEFAGGVSGTATEPSTREGDMGGECMCAG